MKKARILLELNDKAEEILSELAEKNGETKAAILRQGLALRDIYQNETDDNKKMVIADPKKKIIEKEIVLVK